MSDKKPELEITEWDLNLIRSRVIDEHVNTSKPVHVCYVDIMMQFIRDKGFNIVKDETREPTWSSPKESWYTKYKPGRTNW